MPDHISPHFDAAGFCWCPCSECRSRLIKQCWCTDCPCDEPEDHPVSDSAGEDLRWHYGPTESDPYPGSMWCYDCGAQVWCFEDGYICSGCKRQSEE